MGPPGLTCVDTHPDTLVHTTTLILGPTCESVTKLRTEELTRWNLFAESTGPDMVDGDILVSTTIIVTTTPFRRPSLTTSGVGLPLLTPYGVSRSFTNSSFVSMKVVYKTHG